MATASARPAPTAAVVPDAAASAVVVTVADWVAAAVTEPVTVSAGPASIVAPVLTFETEIATSGVMAVPPAAPFCAFVVIVSALVAVSVRSCALARAAPAPTSALVEPLPMSTATEAPTPAEEPDMVGTACAVLSAVVLAATVTLAPPASTPAAVCTSAVVLDVARFSASAPATIALPPPSVAAPMPEVALADELAVGASASTTTFGAAQHGFQIGQFAGLGEIIEHALADRRDGRVERRLAGENDRVGLGRKLFRPGDDVDPLQARHVQIDQQAIVNVPLQGRHGGRAVGADRHLVPHPRQFQPHHFLERFLIVGKQQLQSLDRLGGNGDAPLGKGMRVMKV